MALYAIGDLHLSFGTDKPMDKFGENWTLHYEKIKADWTSRVTETDVVVLPGDSSWAMSFSAAEADLRWVDGLPGRKIIFKGNHDYWWVSKNKMTGMYNSIEFIHNDFAVYEDYAICGTRGWICPNDAVFTEQDEKIYKREALRLENSIQMAQKAGFQKILGVLHYPPTNDLKDPSLFTELFEKYGIEEVIYGHIHAAVNFKYGVKGWFRGVNYHLTSCDFLDFKLFKWL
ncbi:metallophosphoesterase [Fusibacter tunisiensis]|uniref:Phosphohydrolase n=1 Tax=Fusibacter tunisiensis TaxID=1008308 RepID=A0ABS2MRY4_9FIRM|nr:metallophosphoesterase [Fusibacter tunisiensis]MBM7562158.1 putative phosphohydrolase [Fusibacter tunisiensis]